MTDITAELAALPKKRAGDVDSLLDFYEARLALAERRYAQLADATADTLKEHPETACCAVTRQHVADARAYLAFRDQESAT